MNNNFMGGSINHGNGWATTSDPRGDIHHYTGQQNNHSNDFSDRFSHGHNVMHEHARNHSRMQQIHQQEAERALREHEERERADRERIEREQREREESERVEREHRERLEREQQERERQERERIEREHREHVERERHERVQRERRERHEQDIKRAQCDSSSNHLKDVQFNKDESTKRSAIYNLETNKLLNIIDDQTDNDISISLSILKEKKALGVKWLEKIEDLLVRQNKHFSMINTHFDNCIRDVRASDQKNETKDRLSTRWNELRNIEISNKKMIIGFSQREIDEIKKFITTVDKSIISFNEKLLSISNQNKTNTDSLADKIRFLNTSQRAAKEEQITTCETVRCMALTHAKWGVVEASQIVDFAAGMIASVPVELYDSVKGILDAAMNPSETATALKALINSDNVLGHVAEAIKQKWIAHIDNMNTSIERGGRTAYLKAGLEGGKLTTDVSLNLLGGISVAKAGVSSAGRIVKAVTKADTIKLSTAQQLQLISDCSDDPAKCQQKYSDVLADSIAVKQALGHVFGEDIPIKMFYDLTATWIHQIQADGVAATNKVSKALQQQYDLDDVQASIIVGAAASAFAGIGKGANKLSTVNLAAKIATGETVGTFEKNIFGLSPGERISIVKQVAAKVVVEQGMVKNNKVTQMNGGRDVYIGKDGNLYALDTQHGRFEVVSPKGKHMGEVDFSMQIRKPADKSGKHNLRVK